MSRWLIELNGKYLRKFAEQFPEEVPPEINFYIYEKEGKFYLSGSAFDEYEDKSKAKDIKDKAEEILKEIYFVLLIENDLDKRLEPPMIKQIIFEGDDGKTEHFIFPKTLIKYRSLEKPTLPTSIDNISKPQMTQAQELLKNFKTKSKSNYNLQEIFKLVTESDLDPNNLYRIYEELKMHVGDKLLKMCDKKELKLFRYCCQVPEVVGIDARHAKGKFSPPKKGMSLENAKKFIAKCLKKVIQDGK